MTSRAHEGCQHRLGYVDTSTGPECVYCQELLCVDCRKVEPHPDYDERCPECETQRLVAAAEERCER